MPDALACAWKVEWPEGRTIYAMAYYMDDDGNEQEMSWLIGMMDTPELAQAAVRAHNAQIVVPS